MGNFKRAVREFIAPGSVRHTSIPPLEAGLRPNSRLDEATPILSSPDAELDDIVVARERIFVSRGTELAELLAGNESKVIVDLDGPIGAIRACGENLVAVVDGVGLVAVDLDDETSEVVCSDPLVVSCVTDLAVLDDGSFVVAIGSANYQLDEWAHSLVNADITGSLVLVEANKAETKVDGLAWPAGLEVDGESLLVAESQACQIERRLLSDLSSVEMVIENTAGYPGRMRKSSIPDKGVWVAVPYMRNRAVELILSEPKFLEDMQANIEPRLWMVPALRSENVYRDPLQIGQMRVMGVLKPWAPPRSYGLAFLLDNNNRVVDSVHSRPDGNRHGVTGVFETEDGRLLACCRGGRAILEIS